MKSADLRRVLTEDIAGIEIEDYNGNTIFILDLSTYDLADIDNGYIRLQITEEIKEIMA